MADRIAAVDYTALESALDQTARFTLRNASDDERSTSKSYARDLILHALNGQHKEYLPAAIDIARYGSGEFSFQSELKHYAYTALAESLIQLLALTPRIDRPDLCRWKERPEDAERRVLDTIAGMYLIAQETLASRIALRTVTDGVFCDRRQALDQRVADANGMMHEHFTRFLTQDIVALAKDYLATQQEALARTRVISSPFRLVAREPASHVRYLRVTFARFTGRSPAEFS